MPPLTTEILRHVLNRVSQSPGELATILDEQPVALIAFTAERAILAANASAERFFGYGRRELDARATDELLPQRLRQPDAPPQIGTKDVVTVGLPGLRKDGAEVETVWTFGSSPGPDGPIFVTVVRDPDEASVQATEAQFRVLANMIPVLAWYAEPDGSIPWFNSRWFEFTGTKPEDQVGWGWQSVHDPADLPRVLAKWRDALSSGHPWEDEFRLRGRNREFRWFLSRATALRDGTGRILRWFGTTVDIDEQKRASDRLQEYAEAELHAAEERFHQLVDAISDYAVLMLDAGGRIATWNPGAEKIKGYKEGEILGRYFSVFYSPEDRAAGKPERILDAVRREGRFEDESWRVRKDGSRFWANVVITALRNQRGELTGFAKITRDLTAKRAAEEKEQQLMREQIARAASERASQELERVSRAKDEFLATMSHELRTPLNAILGWATILRKDRWDEDKLERGLDAIERNAKAQTKLINDLLDVSSITTGKLRLALGRAEMFPLLVTAADVVRPAAEAKGVRLVVDVDPAIGAAVADPERLQQVMWNLLTNAMRFTPAGGRVTLTGERAGSAIVIRVEDTGIGISKDHLPYLFERFMQVDSSTTRRHGGLGLGLSIVRHLVEAHGGTVQAESGGAGLGSSFIVTLPVRAVERARSEPPEAGPEPVDESRPVHAPSRRMTLRDVRILVVEDDPDSLEVLRTLLEGAGAVVTAATSAREALEALEDHGSFDVMVSDLGLPEMDGYTLIGRIRALDRGFDLPAIALTAFARSEDAERARRAGYQEHLAKPVEEGRLVEAVSTWSRRSSPGVPS